MESIRNNYCVVCGKFWNIGDEGWFAAQVGHSNRSITVMWCPEHRDVAEKSLGRQV